MPVDVVTVVVVVAVMVLVGISDSVLAFKVSSRHVHVGAVLDGESSVGAGVRNGFKRK